MKSIDRYEELKAKQKEFTALSLKQRAELDAFNAKIKLSRAEKAKKKKLEEDSEQTLLALRDILRELPIVEENVKREALISAADTRRATTAQLANEIIYIDGTTALVQRCDGTVAFCEQQEGTASIGDLVLEDDLEDFGSLSVERQTELVDGYRKEWARRIDV